MTMKVLPRYRTWESGVGCAEHQDPECLCDVIVTEPAPILVRAPHKHHAMIMDELDDDKVSARNIHEFASILLGLHKLEVALEGWFDSPTSRPIWDSIPEDVAMALKMHARADTPVEIAMMETEGLGLVPLAQRALRQAYTVMAASQRAHERRRGTTARAVAVPTKHAARKAEAKSSDAKRPPLSDEELEKLRETKRQWERDRKARYRAKLTQVQ